MEEAAALAVCALGAVAAQFRLVVTVVGIAADGGLADVDFVEKVGPLAARVLRRVSQVHLVVTAVVTVLALLLVGFRVPVLSVAHLALTVEAAVAVLALRGAFLRGANKLG